jgi:hypothetical protein
VRELAVSAGVADQVHITGKRAVLECAQHLAPQLERCCLEGQEKGAVQIGQAVSLGCRRIQFSVGCCNDEDIQRAVDLGLFVNYFYCDRPVEAERLFGLGVTALLTNRPDLVRP